MENISNEFMNLVWSEVSKEFFEELNKEKIGAVDIGIGEREFYKVANVCIQKVTQLWGSTLIEQYYVADINS
jgi:hypothetical protein